MKAVLAGERNRIFLVSKVETNELSGDGIAHACAASLARLGTEHLDLYLPHQRVPSEQLPGVVVAFEKLRAAGTIRAWGCIQFRRGTDGTTVARSTRQALCHQPGALQSEQA